MKKSTLIKLFCAVIILVASCSKQKMFKKMHYEGILYDHNTGLPMSGVTVKLEACGGGPGDKAMYGCTDKLFDIGSATTDAAGHFSFSAKAARSNIYYVFIIYNGMRYGAFSNGASEGNLNAAYSKIYLYH